MIFWVVYDPYGSPQFHAGTQVEVANWVLGQPFDPDIDRKGGYRYKTKDLILNEEPPVITPQQARRREVDLDKILKPKEEHEERL